MVSYFISLLLLIFMLLGQGLYTTFPLFLVGIIVISVVLGKELFLEALIGGIFLDSFMIRALGSSSLFFIAVLFIIALYKKKFETKSMPFVVFITGISSLLFLLLFDFTYIIPQVFLCVILAVLLFNMVEYIHTFLKPRNSTSVIHI